MIQPNNGVIQKL